MHDSQAAMLSVPTLWIVFVINFSALGLVWAYVMRSYPTFETSRYWTASACCAALGATLGMLRLVVPPLIPLMCASMLLIAATSLAAMGIERFYGRPASWRLNIAIVALGFVGLNYFLLVEPSTAMRIFVYSVAQSVPVALTLPFVLARTGSRRHPGARLAGYMAVLIIAVNLFRGIVGLFNIGGEASMVNLNPIQAASLLALVFLSMAWNFGFLLMAIDRLRDEIADLAMSDDLTGVANRRRLLQCLADQCVASGRSGEAFTVLAIDLDGFKAINDGFGHGAGDECLRLMTRAVQSRLRSSDLLARSGGDEFCVVLPATTLREGAMIARHVIEACRKQLTPECGAPVAIGASIGVAQWTPAMGRDPGRLIAAADQALYAAKNQGKNRYAVYQPAPPPPEPIELRRSA